MKPQLVEALQILKHMRKKTPLTSLESWPVNPDLLAVDDLDTVTLSGAHSEDDLSAALRYACADYEDEAGSKLQEVIIIED